MSELFNQPLAAIDVNKRLAFGQPSQLGCDNILISSFIAAILSYVRNDVKNITISPGNSDSFILSSQAILGVNISDVGVGGYENFKVKIGTTAGGSDIADLELTVGDTNGFRQALSYSCAGSKTIYITEYSTGSSGMIQICIELKKIYS